MYMDKYIYTYFLYTRTVCTYICVSLYQSPYLLQAGFLNQDSLSSRSSASLPRWGRFVGTLATRQHLGVGNSPWARPTGAAMVLGAMVAKNAWRVRIGGRSQLMIRPISVMWNDVKARDKLFDVYIIQCKAHKAATPAPHCLWNSLRLT